MPRQADLFPQSAPSTALFDTKRVDLELHLHDSTGLAWLLSKTGMQRDAKWLPKAVAERSETFPRMFSIPRATAIEKGLM